MSTERYTIEKAFAMVNECFDRLYNNEPVKSVHDWGSSTLEMIDDTIRTYKTGVAKIDKNYLILIMNKVHNRVYLHNVGI